MNKTLLKSVAILGLATTALSTAQPVGAIVNQIDSTLESQVKKRLDSVSNGGTKLQGIYITTTSQKIDELLDLAIHLTNRNEYSYAEYSDAVKKLRETTWAYEEYIKTINFSNLSIAKYEFIKSDLNYNLYVFAKEVAEVQENNQDLLPLSFYWSTPHKNIKGIDVYARTSDYFKTLGEGNYDSTYHDYYEKFFGEGEKDNYLSQWLEYFWSRYNLENSQLVKEYNHSISSIYKLLNEIQNSIAINPDDEKSIMLKSQMELILNTEKARNTITTYRPTVNLDNTGRLIPSTIILTEDIPNLKIAREKIKDLEHILTEYKDDSHSKQVTSLPSVNINQKENRNNYNFTIGYSKNAIRELPKHNRNSSGYLIVDEEDDQYYDNSGNLKSEYKDDVRKHAEGVNLDNSLPMVTTIQTIVQPVFNRQKVETFTVYYPGVFSGRTNTASLNTLSGESSPQSPIIGGSRSVTLAGQEGERAVVETGSETPVEEISGSNSEVLPTLSGESHQVEVTYNTSSQSVTEVTPKAPAMPATPAEAEPVTEARDRSYQIHKANEAIGFANEMVNSIQFYKYQADFDATRATELEAEIKVARAALENFLSNPADEAFTDAMVDAQVDRLEVLEANLKTMKEAYAQTVNAKINDVIGQFNEAVNMTKYKLANTEYQEGVDDVFEQLYGEGKQLTVALDNLLAEGLVDLNQVHYALLQLEEVANKVAAIGN